MSDQEPIPTAAEQILAREEAEARAEAARHRAAAERARLEAEVEKRRARTETARPADKPDLVERARKFVEKHAQRARVTDGELEHADAPHDEAPAETVARLRVTARQQAWVNSLRLANIEEELSMITLDDLEPYQHPDKLRAYVANLRIPQRGRNLVLAGPIGAGKTAAAVALGAHAAAGGLMVRFMRHKDYLTWLTPSGARPDLPEWQLKNRCRVADLLILDDLGAELDRGAQASQHVRRETLSLIGDRVESGKGTVITTNEPFDVLEVMLGERTMSRISQRGAVLKIIGPDRRRKASMRW